VATGGIVRVDLWVPTVSPYATPELLAVIGREAEERGVGTIWVGEHVVLFDEYASEYPYAADGKIPASPDSGMLEPLNTLSFLAAHTTTVRLGTAMVLLPQRNPVYTAKEVATLDWLSNGRVDFGIGVGWLEEEFNAVNVPWPQRGKRTDEYLRVLETLWCDERSAFEGEFYTLNRCSMFPKPVQAPHPPIPPSTSAGKVRPPWPGRPGRARGGTPSTGHRTTWRHLWPDLTS
jgi:probable F420-dependent oxidoreductase